jgi:hypothetical protein
VQIYVQNICLSYQADNQAKCLVRREIKPILHVWEAHLGSVPVSETAEETQLIVNMRDWLPERILELGIQHRDIFIVALIS